MRLVITNQKNFDVFVKSYRIEKGTVIVTWNDDIVEENTADFFSEAECFSNASKGEYPDWGFRIERTKEEVLAKVREELEMGNTIVYSTNGQGASGLSLFEPNGDIESFIRELDEATFNGMVVGDIQADLEDSEYFDPDEEEESVYEFEEQNGGANPLKYQLIIVD